MVAAPGRGSSMHQKYHIKNITSKTTRKEKRPPHLFGSGELLGHGLFQTSPHPDFGDEKARSRRVRRQGTLPASLPPGTPDPEVAGRPQSEKGRRTMLTVYAPVCSSAGLPHPRSCISSNFCSWGHVTNLVMKPHVSQRHGVD